MGYGNLGRGPTSNGSRFTSFIHERCRSERDHTEQDAQPSPHQRRIVKRRIIGRNGKTTDLHANRNQQNPNRPRRRTQKPPATFRKHHPNQLPHHTDREGRDHAETTRHQCTQTDESQRTDPAIQRRYHPTIQRRTEKNNNPKVQHLEQRRYNRQHQQPGRTILPLVDAPPPQAAMARPPLALLRQRCHQHHERGSHASEIHHLPGKRHRNVAGGLHSGRQHNCHKSE